MTQSDRHPSPRGGGAGGEVSSSLLTGQTALITGGGTGIGAAAARALAAQGVRLILAGRRPEPLAQLAAELSAAQHTSTAPPLTLPADVSDPAQVERLFAQALAAAGRLDLLINAAGVFHMRPLTDTSLDFFDATLNVNLRGAFLCCRAVWPHFQAHGGGQIVNIGSVASVEAYPGNAAYGASKSGLHGLSGVLALEGRPHNIRLLEVCPGPTDTAIWAGQAPDAVRARMLPAAALGHLIAYLLATPRQLAFDPIIVRNFHNPWSAP
ncbi:MAG: SDR family oxidoreductase [Anaerolineales bacterium]|nr:SDR family oxidoreductase [Anaerolineales bacterium]